MNDKLPFQFFHCRGWEKLWKTQESVHDISFCVQVTHVTFISLMSVSRGDATEFGGWGVGGNFACRVVTEPNTRTQALSVSPSCSPHSVRYATCMTN